MPRSAIVTGSFIQRGRPVQGLVRFIPSRLWVVVDGITWACLAPEVPLDEFGHFAVLVTATDADPVPWTYALETPAGSFECYVPWAKHSYALPALLSRHGVRIAS